MCREYGNLLTTYEDIEFYSFPQVDALAADGVSARLRELGFGYRAKFIQASAQKLLSLGGKLWLCSLRNLDYSSVCKIVEEFPGVGPKVANCVVVLAPDFSV